MADISYYAGLLDSYKLFKLPFGIAFLSIPFRAKLGYTLSGLDYKVKSIELIEGCQNGITIKKPNQDLFYIADFLIKEEEIAKVKHSKNQGYFCAFSDDDRNIMFNPYFRIVDGKSKQTTPDLGAQAKLLFEEVVGISANEKIRRIKEDSTYREKAKDYSKMLLKAWEEKLTYSKSYPSDKAPVLYNAITQIAKIFREEML